MFGQRKIIFLFFLVVAVTVFLVLLFLYPVAFQAVLVGGLKDVEVDPSTLTLYVSNSSLFCYEDVFKVQNSGNAGLAYELFFNLEDSPAFFSLSWGGEPILVVSSKGLSQKKLRLEPGSSASLTACMLGPSPSRLKLVFLDERFREATENSVAINVFNTDWWNNRFSRRLSLTYVVQKEGFALFEVLGSGEVYVNSKLVGRVHELRGVDVGSLAVVYVKDGANYLLHFQVEAWEARVDGQVEPKGLRSGPVGQHDRVVFAAYVTNSSRIDVYVGGRLEEEFKPAGHARGNVIDVEGLRVELDEYGFSAPSLYVNLSGRILFPYLQAPVYYSDWGSWRSVVVGPVRIVAVFNTSGLSGYSVESYLMVWGFNLKTLQATVWPKSIRRGIILDWATPLVAAEGVSVSLVCGTACDELPLSLERWGVKLCENYWQPGDHRFGYFTLLFTWSELGSVSHVRGRVSSFPGG
ncbi:MAG: hypothetical protein NZ954_04600 [Thermofilaceae archaeon]|nr:hypothetical protein [Thermofilaceae archaeon]